jgi:hypothetical protein
MLHSSESQCAQAPVNTPETSWPRLRVQRETGQLGWYAEGQWVGPLAPDRWLVPLPSLRHGYAVGDGEGRIVERHLVAICDQPQAPRPPSPFVGYREAGPCPLCAFDLHSTNMPGFCMAFEAFGRHDTSTVKRLLTEIIDHGNTPEGLSGRNTPLIAIFADGRLYTKIGLVRFLGFTILGWRCDGETVHG